MNSFTLEMENRVFRGTRGISQKPGVISGFECESVFYTRDELAEL